MGKPTVATLKSFVRKNEGKLVLAILSEFNGMIDGIEQCSGIFKPAVRASETHDHNLGYVGAWLVGRSRDRISEYESPTVIGYRVYNCCGEWIIGINKELN